MASCYRILTYVVTCCHSAIIGIGRFDVVYMFLNLIVYIFLIVLYHVIFYLC